ncbi:hypothetical protein NA56DRAFT_666580 [Hyaloscypha hepaticicola]|uniref:Uncharacterized protein n=1 Tax=Hyaloscypha hepaticicola TaxID=2082293 RepID=A0A2J6PDP9_9HELO|nr:hypothetical protein NA56DRAFT_666580 [Hyaloscypha hepaticicola]
MNKQISKAPGMPPYEEAPFQKDHLMHQQSNSTGAKRSLISQPVLFLTHVPCALSLSLGKSNQIIKIPSPPRALIFRSILVNIAQKVSHGGSWLRMSFSINMRIYLLDTLLRIVLKFGNEEPTGKRPNLGVFDKLEVLSVFIYQLLGVEPVANETEKRRINIFEGHRLNLALDRYTVESSAKEIGRIMVGDSLVDSELLLRASFADNDGHEALGFRRAMMFLLGLRCTRCAVEWNGAR